MSQKGPNIVEVTKEELEQAYIQDDKATMQSVARLFGVHSRTIERWLKHYGIPSKGRKHYKEILDQRLTDKEWLREQMETKPQKQIAKELGVKGPVVSYWANKHGLADENKSEAVKAGLKKTFPNGTSGPLASNWKGGRQVLKTGYVKVYAPNHPRATKAGYVMEHRLVMEKMIGRYLEPHEEVHHDDGVKSHNDPSNLVLKAKGKNISDHFKASHEVTKLRQRVKALETLLKKYIEYIKDVEGTDYITIHDHRFMCEVKFTEEEWQELERLAEQEPDGQNATPQILC